MSDGDPKYSFRMDQGEIDDLKENADENELDASKVMRSMAKAYNNDEDVQEFVNEFYAGNVSTLDEFYESEDEALDDMAQQVQEKARGLDPEGVDQTLVGLMEGLHERDEDEVYQAARDFGEMDSDLGVTVARYAGKFAEDYWDEGLE